MKTLTREQMNTEYLIYKNLTPDKKYKTFIAMKEHSNGSLYPVILKEMDKKRAAIYQNLSQMWNPYIADVYDIFQLTPSNSLEDECCIAVTEYVIAEENPEEECLSLAQFVDKHGKLPESTALFITIQICKGLQEFHKNGFVHRDLKPDNIMICKYDTEYPAIKIIDFGGAKEINITKHADTTVIGTLGYQPPESISSHTTNQSDIYSIGCILNFMLTGHEPGIQQYKKKHHIVTIIEKATNEDSSHRYSNVSVLQKNLEHELRLRTWDKIPVLRALPGFRTHTILNETVALFAYISLLPLITLYFRFSVIRNFLIIFLFYFFIPLSILCNMGNLLRFLPEKIRKNNRSFLITRTIFILGSIFFPILLDYVIGRF